MAMSGSTEALGATPSWRHLGFILLEKIQRKTVLVGLGPKLVKKIVLMVFQCWPFGCGYIRICYADDPHCKSKKNLEKFFRLILGNLYCLSYLAIEGQLGGF